MTDIKYDTDADPGIIQSKKVAVVGYGSQGHAHAQNLRDSGVEVVVALKDGSASKTKAEEAGFTVMSNAEATKWADVVVILAPDQHQRHLYADDVAPNLTDGKALVFGHGFNIRFGYIKPPTGVDVILIAPKGPGHTVRREFEAGRGVPVIVAVENDATGNAWDLAWSYAKGLGALRAGGITTTFTEETETDLFGEQAVLCGGTSQLVQYGFEVLTEAGYQPEIAYFEVLHELKLIVDLMWEGGIAKQRWSISDTAEYGDYTRGPRVVPNEATKAEMKKVLTEIQNGTFTKEWMSEHKSGQIKFKQMRDQAAKHQIEEVGAKLRSMMPWIASNKLVKDI